MYLFVRKITGIMLLLVLGLPGITAQAAEPSVIVLSWDGVRHDYPDLAEYPGLRRMAQDGVRAQRLRPVFPSNTFPGHVSMATGTYPDVHGIVDNAFRHRSRGTYYMSSEADWIQAEPLWITAERQGVPAATYFWVGSETDWRGQGTRYRKAPFDGERSETLKVDQILAWMTLPASQRPRLIMSYWSGVDRVAHRKGPEHLAIREQMQNQDGQLQRLIDGIDRANRWVDTTLIVVSDHGMTVSDQYVDIVGELAAENINAQMIGHTFGQVFLQDPSDTQRAVDILVDLGLPLQVYEASDIPNNWRMRAPGVVGDIVVAPSPPYILSRPSGFEGFAMGVMSFFGRNFGGHGYAPDLADMGGIFFAMGRGVPTEVQLAEVRQIDIAATVAKLLNIAPPAQSEGRAIVGFDTVVGD